MDPLELMERIEEYGADMYGIEDRFEDDADLYNKCFVSFLSEKNFNILEQALSDREYEKAFDASHTLKGIVANLGLTPFLDALNVLVESLRAEKYDSITQQYEEMIKQKERLLSL